MITPEVDGLHEAIDVLRTWQHDEAPIRLHPGDLGWFWRFGAEATAAAVRTWRRDGELLAIALLDGPDVLRLTTAPEAARDEELARQLAEDIARETASVEVPDDALVRDLLFDAGWHAGEPWTPLRRDLTPPVDPPGVQIETTDPSRVPTRTAVHRASFNGSTFTDTHWHAMASGPAYTDARCLLAYDGPNPVAAVTVWSAGPGRPGLIEPLGVHQNHRGQGHGRAITLAAAATLRDLGASTALVCTPSTNTAGVATYQSAGFTKLPERLDITRNT